MGDFDPDIGGRLFLFLGILSASFIFSGAEHALFALSPLDLASLRDRRPKEFELLSRFLAHPRRVLITVLLGNEIANVGASAVATSMVVQWVGPDMKWLAAVIMFPAILFLCELTPKTLAAQHKVPMALFVRRLLRLFFVVVSPVVYAIKAGVDGIVNLASRWMPRSDADSRERSFKRLAREAFRDGTLSRGEVEIVESIFQFADVPLSEIMTPREKIFALPLATRYEDLIWSFKQKQYRRIPIFEERLDRIMGVVHIKDLLRPVVSQKVKDSRSVRSVMRRPLFVPSTLRLDDMFQRLNREKTHMAFVRNDQGGLIGLVTMDDILTKLLVRLGAGRSAAPVGTL